MEKNDLTAKPSTMPEVEKAKAAEVARHLPKGEVGGPVGPEPTRYGDWQQKGRCTDF